ncbi:hypothetical protein [Mucilaginibacter sp. JRF]|nr:hypothetical protein [Mucilaginibacter sp. JRF]
MKTLIIELSQMSFQTHPASPKNPSGALLSFAHRLKNNVYAERAI